MKHKTIANLKANHPRFASFFSRIYALAKYRENRRVITQSRVITDKILDFYSTKQRCYLEREEAVQCAQEGDVIIIKNTLKALGLEEAVNKFFTEQYEIPLKDLASIHEKKSVADILSTTKKIKQHPFLLRLESTLIQHVLSGQPEIYLELMPNLRPHIPFQLALTHEEEIENVIGRGKMNPHGPHKDSWRFHPKNTLNVWLALTEVTSENGMIVLPDSLDYYPRFLRNEIVPGCATYPDRHYITELEPGDTLLFSAELLHGSILNQTDSTRFAFSMRCSTQIPNFHKDFMYNYVQVQPSFSNLTRQKIFGSADFSPESVQTESPSLGPEADNLSIIEKTADYLIIITEQGPRKFPRRCPHKGIDLANASLRGGKLICPQHQMKVCPLSSCD